MNSDADGNTEQKDVQGSIFLTPLQSIIEHLSDSMHTQRKVPVIVPGTDDYRASDSMLSSARSTRASPVPSGHQATSGSAP